MKNISELLGTDVLPPELVESIQEAFNAKIAEAQAQAEESVRNELAQRYEQDKEQLVEAMELMIGDVVKDYETRKTEEIAKLQEARTKYDGAVSEAKSAYKSKLKEHISHTSTFITKHLAEEVKSLRAERKSLSEQRVRAARDVAKLKEALSLRQAEQVKKIDEFVLGQLKRELTEFDQDRRALVETRVKIVAESRDRLRETQQRFVKEAAKKINVIVSESLAREMSDLHEDLERNRKNDFGRRMFEAFAAEYMVSYLSEGTEVRKLQGLVESAKSEITSLKTELTETKRSADKDKRSARLAEDRAVRAQVLAELLGTLSKDNRGVMESMLDGVETPNLKKSFQQLLPVVLKESKSSVTKAPLNEGRGKQTRVVTGDQPSNRLIETIKAEPELDNDVSRVLKLAGRPTN